MQRILYIRCFFKPEDESFHNKYIITQTLISENLRIQIMINMYYQLVLSF